jgi:archaellin
MREWLRDLWRTLATERGDAGVVTGAVIISTVVAGSVLATAVIETETDAAEYLRGVVADGLSRVVNGIEVRGGVVVSDLDADGMAGTGDTVVFTVALTAGGQRLAIEGEEPEIAVRYVTETVSAMALLAVAWPSGAGPDLEPGELAELTVTIPAGTLRPGESFSLEIVAPSGGTVVLERRLPAAITPVMYLH